MWPAFPEDNYFPNIHDIAEWPLWLNLKMYTFFQFLSLPSDLSMLTSWSVVQLTMGQGFAFICSFYLKTPRREILSTLLPIQLLSKAAPRNWHVLLRFVDGYSVSFRIMTYLEWENVCYLNTGFCFCFQREENHLQAETCFSFFPPSPWYHTRNLGQCHLHATLLFSRRCIPTVLAGSLATSIDRCRLCPFYRLENRLRLQGWW